jgi:hypothetical protein
LFPWQLLQSLSNLVPLAVDVVPIKLVVLVRVDFFKMAAIAMETTKMLKNWKTQK